MDIHTRFQLHATLSPRLSHGTNTGKPPLSHMPLDLTDHSNVHSNDKESAGSKPATSATGVVAT